MENIKLFAGLLQVKEVLQNLKYQQLQNQENENTMNLSRAKLNNQSNGNLYYQGNYSPSPDGKSYIAISNAKVLNNLDTPYKNVTNFKKNTQNPLQENLNNYNASNTQMQQSAVQQSQPNKYLKASDMMEISWFKSTIDTLCEDNQILHQNSEDACKVIKAIQKKMQTFTKLDQQIKQLTQEQKKTQKLYNQEKKEKENYKNKLMKLKISYFSLKEKLYQILDEQSEQQSDDEKIYNQLIYENNQLRSLLNINYNEEQLKKIEEKLEKEEGEFFSMYCTSEDKPSEIEIKYMAKQKNMPNANSKKFKNINKQSENSGDLAKQLQDLSNNNQMRGDIANLSSILGSSFSQNIQKGIQDNIMQFSQNEDYESNDYIIVKEQMNDQKIDINQLINNEQKQSKEFILDNTFSPERKVQNKEKMLERKEDIQEIISYDEDMVELGSNSQLNDNLDKDDEDKDQKQLGKKKKNNFTRLSQQEQQSLDEVESFLKQMNYKSGQQGGQRKKGYFDIDDEMIEQTDSTGNEKVEGPFQVIKKSKLEMFNNAQTLRSSGYDDYVKDDDGMNYEQEEQDDEEKDNKQLQREQQNQKLQMNNKQKELAASFANFEQKLRQKNKK